MNREETIEAIKVMQAFVDGKVINSLDAYESMTSPVWDWENDLGAYWIIKDTEYRPYTMEEFQELGESYFKSIHYSPFFMCIQFSDESIAFLIDERFTPYTWEQFLIQFTRLNGEPCGVKIESGEPK